MTAMVFTVMSASLLGSVHCAGMCGPFCGVAVGATGGSRGGVRLHAAYHLGRLATYLVMGAAAGAVGSLLNLASTLAGLQPIALAAAGGLMVLFGLVELARVKRVKIPGARLRPPAAITRLLQAGQRYASRQHGVPRALTVGLLTTLLPCGWLYAFVVTAAGTGGPLPAMLVMTAFWLGTLPVLLTLGVSVRRLAGAFGQKLPVVTALALIAVGLVTLSGRSSLSASTLTTAVVADAADSPESVPDASELPACCRQRLEAD
ncbi:MAG: sulfite exporter TauE/SafE family protein [Planctomycetota bacterium]